MDTKQLINEIEQLIQDDLKMYWFHSRNKKRSIKIQERITKHENLLQQLKNKLEV